MTNTFTLIDIPNLLNSFNSATVANDCLAHFLNSYDFESVYETDDKSIVFQSSDKNETSLEFFNFENPLTRTLSIMYYENGTSVILYY